MRGILIASLSVTLLAGCSRTPSSNSASGGLAAARPKANTDATADRIRDTLAAVHAGLSDADRFTDAFKAVVAPPLPGDSSAKFSPRHWAEYIATFKGRLPEIDEPGNIVEAVRLGRDSTWQFEKVKDSPTPMIFFRMEGSGYDAKIAWLQSSRVSWTGARPGESPVPPWTANAFLFALCDSQDALAAGLMSPSLRANLAPVFSKADEARGYNPGTLAEKLRTLRGSATLFEIDSVDGDTVKGNLVATTAKRPFVIILKNTGPAERAVESFDCP